VVVESVGSSSSSLESVDASGDSVSEVSLVSDVVLGASSGDVVFDDADESVDEPLESLDDELVDDASDPSDVSADATPCPVNTAAPIPRATASPPIRATDIPAPMHKYLPWTLQGGGHLGGIDRETIQR
jgi:hypothetical protein